MAEIVIVFFRTPLIFRQPPLSAVANIFVLPLDTSVWICILIFMLVVFVIMIFQLMHPILKMMSISLLDVATLIWGAVCQQGTHLEIPTTSGRFVVLTTFFATLALFTSYSASIVALLQSPSNFITSIDDLVASPLIVGFHQAGYARFIVRANYSGVSEVYQKKVLPQGEKGKFDLITIWLIENNKYYFYAMEKGGFMIRLKVLKEFAPNYLHFKLTALLRTKQSAKLSPNLK